MPFSLPFAHHFDTLLNGPSPSVVPLLQALRTRGIFAFTLPPHLGWSATLQLRRDAPNKLLPVLIALQVSEPNPQILKLQGANTPPPKSDKLPKSWNFATQTKRSAPSPPVEPNSSLKISFCLCFARKQATTLETCLNVVAPGVNLSGISGRVHGDTVRGGRGVSSGPDAASALQELRPSPAS